MISYTSPKFNNIFEKIKGILLNNNININDSEQKLSNCIMNKIQLFFSSILTPTNVFLSTPCPKCGKCHLEPFSSSYQRNIIFKIGNLLVNIKLHIPRLKCHNCNSTHALLPDFCIPLKQYSNQAILSIVDDATKTSTNNVAEQLNIDSKQVRRFVNFLKTNKNNILLIYHKYSQKFKLKLIIDSTMNDILFLIPKDFNRLFFREFKYVFLYNIKNNRKLYMQYKKLSI